MANVLPGHLRDLDQRPINLKDQPAPPHSGTIHLVEDIEDRAALLAITTVALAVFAPLSALAIFAPFTETFGPALGAGSGGGRNGAGRRCCRLSACGHQMFEFSSVKPHAAAGGTHVELDPRARHGLHGTVVIGAEKKRHGPVPSKEERRDAAAGGTASGLKRVASDITATTLGSPQPEGPGSHSRHGVRAGLAQEHGFSPTMV